MSSFEIEKREAREAGERALRSLEAAREQLRGARNWGIVDMVGGGFLSSIVKRSKMKQAQEDMERAKADLRSFSRELADVEQFCRLGVEVGDFLSFADWFFDGFFVDFLMQERIKKAQIQVEEAIRRVRSVLEQLR